MLTATPAHIPETSAAPSTNGAIGETPSANGPIGVGAPSPNGAIGATPGNPFARKLVAFRLALCNAVTEDDLRAIAAKLLEKAKAGNVAAARLLLAYAIGRPAPFVEPDTIDAHELATQVKQTASAEAVETALHGMPAGLAAQMLRVAVPAQEERLRKVMAAKLRKEEKRAKRRARKARP